VANGASIREGTSELLAELAALHDRVYADDAHPGRPTERILRMLDERHPQRRRVSLRLFVAPGRAGVAAIVNPRVQDGAGRPIGLLGFFESLDDEAAAAAVLGAGAAWLRARGAQVIRGPVDFSTWNTYRLTVAAREPGWFAGEPYHPAYYPRLWEAAGFRVATRYASHWLGALDPVCARLETKAARAAGVTIRPLQAGDLPSLYQLALTGFRGAYLYSAIEPDEFASIYGADRAAGAAATSFVAVDEERPLGFVYTYLAELPRGPSGIVKTIVVLPEARDRGVYHGLLAASLRAAQAEGATGALGALMHAEGEPSLMGWCRPETLFKQYALYELAA
jgi:GNAT superfamily N-acetyltransferase